MSNPVPLPATLSATVVPMARPIAVPVPISSFMGAVSKTPVIKLRQLAVMVGLSPRTLRREIDAGELPAVKVGRRNGGDWVVMHDDAVAYVTRVLQLPAMPDLDVSRRALGTTRP
jgi:excisionase family DNA binding protein